MATPFISEIFGVRLYAVMIVLGVVMAYLLCVSQAKRMRLPQDTVLDLFLLALPLGLVGARLYFVVFHFDLFRDRLLDIFKIWEGGIAIYGGVSAGVIVFLLYSRRKKLPFLRLADLAVPGVLLAQAIGRWGNYFNMEAYGLAVTSPGLQFFPFAVYIPADAQWHMAAFFYEFVWNTAGFLLLWSMRRTRRREGDLLWWYLLWYGAGRLMIEGFRLDSLYLFSTSLRVSQLLAVILTGIVLCLFSYRAFRRGALGATMTGALYLGLAYGLFCWQNTMYQLHATGNGAMLAATLPTGILLLVAIVSGVLLYRQTPRIADTPEDTKV